MTLKHRIPNWLTLTRYGAVPLLVAAWYCPSEPMRWVPLALFVLACVTDFFDGYLARKWKVESNLGRLLDPNADKLLVATALLLLAAEGIAPVVAVAIILCRELWVSGLREHMAGQQISIPVNTLAKWKTTVQMVACALLLAGYGSAHPMVLQAGEAALWLAATLTFITGWHYTHASLTHLK